MKRIIIAFLIGLLALPPSVFGATYYVNYATGSNANNGTAAETPWKDPGYGAFMAAAGDTVRVVASPTSPARSSLVTGTAGGSGTEITFQGTSAASKAYILGSIDATHGTAKGNLLAYHNADMEAWKTAGNPYRITVAGTVPTCRTATTEALVKTGSYCAKFDDTGDDPTFTFNTYIPELTAVTLSWAEYATDETKTLKVKVRCVDNDTYLHDDKTWGADAAVEWGDLQNQTTTNAWATVTVTFTTPDHATAETVSLYQIIFYNDDGTTIQYLDDVSLTVDASTYAWADYVGGEADTYVLDQQLSTPVCQVVLRCNKSAWTASGCLALKYSPDGEELGRTKDTLNQGEFFYDSANNALYYRLSSEESDITNLHFEVGDNRTRLIKGSLTGGVISLAHAYNDAKFFWLGGGNNHGISATAGNNDISYVKTFGIGVVGLYGGHAGIVFSDSESWYSEDNCEGAGTNADVTFIRVKGLYAQDDSFQAHTDGKITCYLCFGYGAGQAPYGEQNGDNAAYSCEGAGSEMVVLGSTALDTYGQAFQAKVTATIIDSIAWNSTVVDAFVDVGATLTHSYNLFGTKSALWVADATEIEGSDPSLNSAGAIFGTSSAAIQAGTDICATLVNAVDLAGHVVCKDGAPVHLWSDGVDIGAYAFEGGRVLMGN